MKRNEYLYIKKTPVSWKFHKAGVSLYKMYLIKSDKLRNLLPCHSSSTSAVSPFPPDLAVLDWSRCRHQGSHWLRYHEVDLRILLPERIHVPSDSCPDHSF